MYIKVFSFNFKSLISIYNNKIFQHPVHTKMKRLIWIIHQLILLESELTLKNETKRLVIIFSFDSHNSYKNNSKVK